MTTGGLQAYNEIEKGQEKNHKRGDKMTLEQRVNELESNVSELMEVIKTQQEAMQIQTNTIKGLQQKVLNIETRVNNARE